MNRLSNPRRSVPTPWKFSAVAETPREYYQALEAIRNRDPRNPLTLMEMAELLGVSHGTVSNWLSGKGISRRYWPQIRLVAGEKIDRKSLLKWGTGDDLGRFVPANEHISADSVAMTDDLRQWLDVWFEDNDLTKDRVTALCGYDKPETLRRIMSGQLQTIRITFLATIIRVTNAPVELMPLEPYVRERLAAVPAAMYQSRRVPIMGIVAAQEQETLTGCAIDGTTNEYINVPTDGHQWFAVYIQGNSMLPIYHNGDVVSGHLDGPVNRGDVVFCRFLREGAELGSEDPGDYLAVVKILDRISGGTYSLVSLNRNEGDDFEVPAERLSWIVAVLQHNRM